MSKLSCHIKVELGSIDYNFDLQANLGVNLNKLNELGEIINLNWFIGMTCIFSAYMGGTKSRENIYYMVSLVIPLYSNSSLHSSLVVTP